MYIATIFTSMTANIFLDIGVSIVEVWDEAYPLYVLERTARKSSKRRKSLHNNVCSREQVQYRQGAMKTICANVTSLPCLLTNSRYCKGRTRSGTLERRVSHHLLYFSTNLAAFSAFRQMRRFVAYAWERRWSPRFPDQVRLPGSCHSSNSRYHSGGAGGEEGCSPSCQDFARNKHLSSLLTPHSSLVGMGLQSSLKHHTSVA